MGRLMGTAKTDGFSGFRGFGGRELDASVLIAASVLAGFGVVMSYSVTAALALDAPIPPLFMKHVGALAAGIAVATAATFVPTVVWGRIALPFWLFCVGALVATAYAGVDVNGARRWLELPGLGMRFQPVELAKCATVLATAAVISQHGARREITPRRLGMAACLAVVPAALLLRQPDLGNTVLLVGLVGLLLVVAGTPLRGLILPACLSAGLLVLYIARNDYARARVIGFLDPWAEAQGSGFQLVQSFVAFGRGGLIGVGLGNSRQKLSYLPEAHTDFVLALIAEELGLLGVLLVLGAFAALLIAGTRIARRAESRFAMLVAFGMTAFLTVPAMLNAAVVMGLVPTKGLTLPFLSYGRTSLVTCCLALGILLGVGRENAAAEAGGTRARSSRSGGRRR